MLPVVTGIALAVMDFDYARLLVDDPIGRRVLGAAIGMLVLGIVVMNTMIRRMLR